MYLDFVLGLFEAVVHRMVVIGGVLCMLCWYVVLYVLFLRGFWVDWGLYVGIFACRIA
jgi:hypothetical protein